MSLNQWISRFVDGQLVNTEFCSEIFNVQCSISVINHYKYVLKSSQLYQEWSNIPP